MACFGMCGGDSPVDDSIIVLIDAAVPVGLEVDNLGKGKKAIVVDNVKPNTACAKVRRTPPLLPPPHSQPPPADVMPTPPPPRLASPGIWSSQRSTKKFWSPASTLLRLGTRRVAETSERLRALSTLTLVWPREQIKAVKARGGKFSLTFNHLPPPPPGS